MCLVFEIKGYPLNWWVSVVCLVKCSGESIERECGGQASFLFNGFI